MACTDWALEILCHRSCNVPEDACFDKKKQIPITETTLVRTLYLKVDSKGRSTRSNQDQQRLEAEKPWNTNSCGCSYL